MIRVMVSFLVHRLVLIAIAFAAINFAGQTHLVGEDSLPNIRPLDGVGKTLLLKLDRIPEVAAVRKIMPLSSWGMMKVSHSPFLWLCAGFSRLTHLVPLFSILLLSNLFFLIFLIETHSLLSRMVSEEMATAVGVMMVFWPASYELSLGSGFCLTAMLVVRALRAALDDNWFSAGTASALVTVTEPLGIGLFPILVYFFIYFQRSHPPKRIALAAAGFLIPAVSALVWRYPEYAQMPTGTIWSGVKWSLPFLAQTLTVVFFGVGTVLSMVGAAVWIHRLLPPVLLLLLLTFSPYTALASRAPMAGLCLTGFVGGWKPITKLIQMSLFSLSLQEVFRAFS